jgi:hypothetical protein
MNTIQKPVHHVLKLTFVFIFYLPDTHIQCLDNIMCEEFPWFKDGFHVALSWIFVRCNLQLTIQRGF